MPFLELFDETLDINSTENYELSVQLSPDGLSFCVLDLIRNKYVLIRSFEPDENKYFSAGKVGETISKDDFLTKKYKKVRVIIPSSKFTLVPAPLFDPARIDEYFVLNHLKEDNEVILSNKISDPDTFLLFTSLTAFNDLVKSLFPDALQFHHIKPLLCQISHNRKNSSGHYIHLNVERDFFNLIIFENNLLKFCNTFNYRKVSDILFYVLNAFKNLGINQEETIHLSGQTGNFHELTSSFAIYVRHIVFAIPTGNFTFSYVFNDLDLYRYLNLLTLVNCE